VKPGFREIDREPLAAFATNLYERDLKGMKMVSLISVATFFFAGTIISKAADLTRISNETGVSADTLQAERTSTGLGWGELEKAHLLANASGRSFDDVVAAHQGGEGWGKIARDNGLNLGRVVSGARRSSKATSHAQNSRTAHGNSSMVHGRSASHIGRGHGKSMTMGSIRRGSSNHASSHGMAGMNHGAGHGR
jgi:hypothetical protein